MTSPKPHVLIIEDEPKIAQILVDILTAEGFSTSTLPDGLHAVHTIKMSPPDFLILDLMLPHKDGLTICKEVRQFSDLPILMLTARVDEIDRLVGLEFGADDYVCKPFSAREVVARVKTILKRTQHSQKPSDSMVSYQGIRIDLERHVCSINHNSIDLTPVEFRLLRAMVERPGVVFSRDKLMQCCYEDERIVSHRTIDSHMKNLRAKLSRTDESREGDQHDSTESLLHAIYGVGYKLE